MGGGEENKATSPTNPRLGWRSLESEEVYMKKVPLSSASPFAVAPDAITTGK